MQFNWRQIKKIAVIPLTVAKTSHFIVFVVVVLFCFLLVFYLALNKKCIVLENLEVSNKTVNGRKGLKHLLLSGNKTDQFKYQKYRERKKIFWLIDAKWADKAKIALTWQAANVGSGGRHCLGESDWVKECAY